MLWLHDARFRSAPYAASSVGLLDRGAPLVPLVGRRCFRDDKWRMDLIATATLLAVSLRPAAAKGPPVGPYYPNGSPTLTPNPSAMRTRVTRVTFKEPASIFAS